MPEDAMSRSAYAAEAPGFSVGAVLSRSFYTLFKHPFVFIGLSFMAQIPGILLVTLAMAAARYDVLQAVTTAVGTVNGIFGLVIQGAIAYGVYEVLMSRRARFSVSVYRGLARVIPLIFAVLCCFIFMALIAVAITAAVSFVSGFLVLAALIVGAAVMSVLWCKWSVFVPACVVERLGPVECLNRSSDLTKGCRLKIFGIYLLGFILAFVFAFIMRIMQGAFSVTFIRAFGLMPGMVLLLAAQQIIMAIPMAFLHITTSAAYYGLREAKEGVSVDLLANVFD